LGVANINRWRDCNPGRAKTRGKELPSALGERPPSELRTPGGLGREVCVKRIFQRHEKSRPFYRQSVARAGVRLDSKRDREKKKNLTEDGGRLKRAKSQERNEGPPLPRGGEYQAKPWTRSFWGWAVRFVPLGCDVCGARRVTRLAEDG